MVLPPTSTRTLEIPAASGSVRRRSAAASASSSASSSASNEPGCFTWNSTPTSRHHLDQRAPGPVVDIAVPQGWHHFGGGQHEDPAAGADQPLAERKPLLGGERRPRHRHLERARPILLYLLRDSLAARGPHRRPAAEADLADRGAQEGRLLRDRF